MLLNLDYILINWMAILVALLLVAVLATLYFSYKKPEHETAPIPFVVIQGAHSMLIAAGWQNTSVPEDYGTQGELRFGAATMGQRWWHPNRNQGDPGLPWFRISHQ